MAKYVFRDGWPKVFPNSDTADANKVGRAIEKTLARHPGVSRQEVPEVLLKEARDPAHPLHRHIIWDDKVAAHLYRVEQVRYFMQIVREVDDEGEEVPAFISIVRDTQEPGYYTRTEVVSSLELQILTMKNAERDLDAWVMRYNVLSEVCTLVREAKVKVIAMRSKLETRG